MSLSSVRSIVANETAFRMVARRNPPRRSGAPLLERAALVKPRHHPLPRSCAAVACPANVRPSQRYVSVGRSTL